MPSPPRPPAPCWKACAGMLALTAVCGALGNSLEPISTLAWLQPLAALLAHDAATALAGPAAATAALALTLTVSSTLGFLKAYALAALTPAAAALVALISLLTSASLALLSFLPSAVLRARHPTHPAASLAFPLTFTTVFFLLGLTPISTFPAPAYALLDYRPLAGLASALGAHGLNFLLAALASYAHLHLTRPPAPPFSHGPTQAARLPTAPADGATAGSGDDATGCEPPTPSAPTLPRPHHAHRHPTTALLAAFLLLTAAAAWLQQPSLYQRSISTEARPALSASCIVSPEAPYATPAAASILAQTAARLAAADHFVLWSEGAIIVQNTSEEAALLARLSGLVRAAPSNASHLGATFFNSATFANMFVLFAPDGLPAWRYQKAHPVPFIGDGAPGPPVVPTYHSPSVGLRLAGAICFDMDYPEFIRQAGVQRTDLFLQVSSTWGAIGHRHFWGNALRAPENGMTLFRCSSGGDSGVVTPRFEVVSRQVTLFSGTTTYTIPAGRHVRTLYVYFGWLLPYACCVGAVAVWVLAMVHAAGACERKGYHHRGAGAAVEEQPLLRQQHRLPVDLAEGSQDGDTV